METARFNYTVGGLLARSIRREIASYAWSKGLTVDFEEEGSWLNKAVRVTLRGKGAQEAGRVLLLWLSTIE